VRHAARLQLPRRRWLELALGGAVLSLVGLRVGGLERRSGPLFVRRLGRAGSDVLCLHGLFASGAFFLPLAEQLSSEARLTIPDLVGFGASPKPNADYTLDFHLGWLTPLLGEGTSWTVIGHSMGCVLAAHLAQRFPDRVRRLLLFNAPVYASADSRRRIFGSQNVLTRTSTRSELAARAICESTVCSLRPVLTRLAPGLSPHVPPQVASDYFRHTWHSYHWSFGRLILERDLLADLTPVRHPILVIQGGRDTLVEAPERVSWPANLEVRVLARHDHASLLLHEPGLAADLVRGFVRSDPA